MIKKRKWRPIYIWFFATVFIAAVVMNIVYMLYYSHNERQLDQTERNKVLGQAVYYVNRYMKEIEDSTNMIATSSLVQQLLPKSSKINYIDYRDCTEMLTEYAMTIPGIYRIDVYTSSNNTLLTSYEGVYYNLTQTESGVYEKYMESFSDRSWDMHYQGQEPGLVSKMRNENYISLVQPIYSIYNGKKRGIVCVSVEISEFDNLIQLQKAGKEEIYLSYKGEYLTDAPTQNTSMKHVEAVSEETNMKFDYYYFETAISFKKNMTVMLATILIILLFTIVFLSIVGISERKMFYPAKQLLMGFNEIENGHFDIRLDENRNDMFCDIFHHFNHMADTLNKMVEELSNERTHRNEFKFRLLQMQIKPHFLYNLFNNMIWLLEQKDYDRLETLIQSTAGYYKTALNYGNREIMLLENKKQLEYYVEIQKIRFGDIFSFKVDLEDEIELYSIPNLLLQPLVENAILHGLKGKDNGNIEVKGYVSADMLIISVEDDGCGIEEEHLLDIQKEMQNYEGDGSKYFALVNVNARLHSRYKGCADMSIISKLGEGTKVILQIPLDEVEKCID